jgi:XTP/dITP diphosphohydrolase
MTRRTVLIATSNAGKLREIREVFAGWDLDWKALADYAGLPEPVEDRPTFAENAAKKALHYAALAGVWTLADDSGLEVDALDGAPGVSSARYAGPDQDSAANNVKLIAALRGVPAERRSARFRCALALSDGRSVLATASGAIEGVIIDEPRGRNGFGYDPHFLLPELGRTTAELDAAHKNSISHRGRALRSLQPQMEALLRADSGASA